MLNSVREKIDSIDNLSCSVKEHQLQSALQRATHFFDADKKKYQAQLAKWLLQPSEISQTQTNLSDKLNPRAKKETQNHQFNLDSFPQSIVNHSNLSQTFFNQLYANQNSVNRINLMEQSRLVGRDGAVVESDFKLSHLAPRKYQYWYELALALCGWVESKQCRRYEKELAKESYRNIYLDTLINSLISKLHGKLNRTMEKDETLRYPLTMELLSGQTLIRECYTQQDLQSATEFGYYRIALSNSVELSDNGVIKTRDKSPMAILKAPYQYHLQDKIALLHDLSEYLGEHQPWNPQSAGQWLVKGESEEDCIVTSDFVDGRMLREHSISSREQTRAKKKEIRGVGLSLSSRNESASSTLIARKYNLPLWGGHSMSLVRMLNMARWASANQYELTAIAQGTAAFWQLALSKDFIYTPGNKSIYHTFHETMDMAKNFGVKYELQECRKNQIGFKMDKVGFRIDKVDSDYLLEYVYQTAQDILHMIEGIVQNQALNNIDSTIDRAVDNDIEKNTENNNQKNWFVVKQQEVNYLLGLIEKQVHDDNQKAKTESALAHQDTCQFHSFSSTCLDLAEKLSFRQSVQKMVEIEQELRRLKTKIVRLNENNKKTSD